MDEMGRWVTVAFGHADAEMELRRLVSRDGRWLVVWS